MSEKGSRLRDSPDHRSNAQYLKEEASKADNRLGGIWAHRYQQRGYEQRETDYHHRQPQRPRLCEPCPDSLESRKGDDHGPAAMTPNND